MVDISHAAAGRLMLNEGDSKETGNEGFFIVHVDIPSVVGGVDALKNEEGFS